MSDIPFIVDTENQAPYYVDMPWTHSTGDIIHVDPGKKRRRDQKKEGGYPCSGCGKVFHREADRTKHRKNHISETARPYACSSCEKRFLYPKDLSRHLYAKHEKDEAGGNLHPIFGKHVQGPNGGDVAPESPAWGSPESGDAGPARKRRSALLDEESAPWSFSALRHSFKALDHQSAPEESARRTGATYAFEPLDTNEIRVLEISAASSEVQEIQCTLKRCQIGSVKYEALSYTWGEPDEQHSIWVDTFEKPVRPNLYTALRHLRKAHEPRWLWVDALCINQDDSTEKSSQVRLMANIYQSAELVCIWLGAPSDSSHLAMQFFGGAVDMLSRLALLDDTCDEVEDDIWQAVAALLSRPWFSRLWIVQEIAMAKEARVYCGLDEVSWADLEETVAFMQTYVPKKQRRTHKAGSSELKSDIDQLGAGRLLRAKNAWYRTDSEGRLNELSLTLAELMSASWFLDCTDPRDRVFALLALARDAHEVQEKNTLIWPVPEPSLSSAQPSESDLPITRSDTAMLQSSNGALMAVSRTVDFVHMSLRDYVLGQGPELQHFAIRPNYLQDVAETFKQVVRMAARDESRGCLDIIRRPWSYSAQLSAREIPSWVPYWSDAPFTFAPDSSRHGKLRQKRRNADPLVGFTAEYAGRYNACRSLTAKFGLDWGFVRRGEAAISDMWALGAAYTRGLRDTLASLKLEGDAIALDQGALAFGTMSDRFGDLEGRTSLESAYLDGKSDFVRMISRARTAPVTQSGSRNNWGLERSVRNCDLLGEYGSATPQSLEDVMFVTGFPLDSIDELLDSSQKGFVPEDWLTLGGYDRKSPEFPEELWQTLVANRDAAGQRPSRLQYEYAFKVAADSSGGDGIDIVEVPERGDRHLIDEVLTRMESVVFNRRLFRSRTQRRLGLSPKGSRSGDVIFIVAGLSVPLLLRPTMDRSYYQVIGECYLHGMMEGEALRLLRPRTTHSENGESEQAHGLRMQPVFIV